VIATAWAQQSGAPIGPPAAVNFLFFGLIFLLFYFLVVAPERRKRREHDALLAGLKRNDAVVLTGGLHGRVTAMADDTITVEIAPKVPVVVDRAAVQRVGRGGEGETREKERQRS
jgi:preprotein translocase subunit YajC